MVVVRAYLGVGALSGVVVCGYLGNRRRRWVRSSLLGTVSGLRFRCSSRLEDVALSGVAAVVVVWWG